MTEIEKEIEQKKKELQELEKKLSNEKLHSYIASLNIHDGDYISCNDSLCYTYYFRYFENRLTGKKNKVEPVCEIGFNLKYEYSDIAIRGLDRFASELRDDVDRVFILRKQEKA